ncbi:MAG TPA: nucleotide sugar dehydrogenase [Casimicrobiaceae bacterium]|nr:nucleotide sugar dehydrogenase [Casimicrobiaceae bacterium]
MKISIFGLGYVGAVSLACLARDGHDVVGVDVDPSKLALIREGRTPVVEEGMVELMRNVAVSSRVSVTDDVASAIVRSDISLVCVGTPSAPNGSQDQSALVRLAGDVGRALREKNDDGHVIVFRSTMVPGTVEDVLAPILERESGKRAGEAFHVCFQPEFLREGSSIRDYDKPPFTIVGAATETPVNALRGLFGHLPCEFISTSIRTAEMVKYSCNNFHALKIVFANETARLCESLRVDPFEVMDLLCRDRQLNISPAYLRPGFAYGGSCLPKDLRATLHLAKLRDVELPVHAAIGQSNQLQVDRAIAKILDTGKRRIGVIGLSFKSGTDDLRESPMVRLTEHLIGKGCEIAVCDPDVHLSRLLGANRRFIDRHVPHLGALMLDRVAEVVSRSDVLVLGLANERLLDELEDHLREHHIVMDLAGVPRRHRGPATWTGLCW